MSPLTCRHIKISFKNVNIHLPYKLGKVYLTGQGSTAQDLGSFPGRFTHSKAKYALVILCALLDCGTVRWYSDQLSHVARINLYMS